MIYNRIFSLGQSLISKMTEMNMIIPKSMCLIAYDSMASDVINLYLNYYIKLT